MLEAILAIEALDAHRHAGYAAAMDKGERAVRESC
jgi:hypothetical protein